MAKKKTSSKVKNSVKETENVDFVQVINADNDANESNSVDTAASTFKYYVSEIENESVKTNNFNEENMYSKENPYGVVNDENMEQMTNISDRISRNKRFEDMPLELLLKYKEAISSLNKEYTYLVEINKDYDRITYYDALSKSKKMLNYLEKVNEVIENKILEIKID